MVHSTQQAVGLALSDAQRRALRACAGDDADAARARRARIVLAAADGASDRRVAAELGVAASTVGLWRRRFTEEGLDALAPANGRQSQGDVAAQRGPSRHTGDASASTEPPAPEAPAPEPGRPAPEWRSPPAGSDPAAPPPADAAVSPPTNLPLPFSTFVGRRRELAEVEGLLAASRVVTLTGEPGVGKSRLALETARRLLADFPGGVWQVELAAVAEPRLVPDAVAATVGVAEHPGQPTSTHSLVEDLCHRRPLLLVLDDCEHLVASCGELVAALAQACPAVTVLATSQEPLGVAGERVWRVSPLAPPAPDDDPGAVQASEAVALFCERAGGTEGALQPDAETAADVADVCRRLDGIPLAIEVAAARVGVLTPAQIRARLADRVDVLAADADRGGRHHTLQAAIAWSYELLAPPQQLVLARMSVFAGEISLEAAEAVCAGGQLSADDVFYHLAGLVDRSLVVGEVAGRRARYRLLETIRAFAGQRLVEAGEADATRQRFVDWFLEVAEHAEARLVGPDQAEWVARLDADHDNLAAAVDDAVALGRGEAALRLAGAMAAYWRLRGHLREGVEVLGRCLATDADADAGVRAKAAWGAGVLAALLGELAAAEGCGEDSLQAARAAGEPATVARAQTLLGFVAMYGGELGRARQLLDDGVAAARRAADEHALVEALDRCGQAHLLGGDAHAATPAFAECYDVARRLGDRQGEASALVGQGWAAMDHGDYEIAEARIRQAEDLARAIGDRCRTGEALAFLGELARRRDDLDEAEARFGECREVAEATRVPLLRARSLGGLGRVALARQRDDEAWGLFEEAAAVAGSVGLPYVHTRMLFGSAACATAHGHHQQAKQALEDALATADAHDDRQGVATATYALAVHAREHGQLEQAARLHADALERHVALDDSETIARSLEGVAAVALDRGEPLAAARLFGAADAVLQRIGRHFTRWPWEAERYQRDVAALEVALGADELDAAWRQGAHRSLADMIAYARRVGADRRPDRGDSPEGLTHAERDVARLVAGGLTSREAGERLFVSPRTVESHLARIYRKLGINSRQQLRALANELTDPELRRGR